MDDQRYRDMAEAQRLVDAAQADIRDIERDSVGWGHPDIESAASDAESALDDLSTKIDEILGKES